MTPPRLSPSPIFMVFSLNKVFILIAVQSIRFVFTVRALGDDGTPPSRGSQSRPRSPAVRPHSGAFAVLTAVPRVAPGTSPGTKAEAGLSARTRTRPLPPAPSPGSRPRGRWRAASGLRFQVGTSLFQFSLATRPNRQEKTRHLPPKMAFGSVSSRRITHAGCASAAVFLGPVLLDLRVTPLRPDAPLCPLARGDPRPAEGRGPDAGLLEKGGRARPALASHGRRAMGDGRRGAWTRDPRPARRRRAREASRTRRPAAPSGRTMAPRGPCVRPGGARAPEPVPSRETSALFSSRCFLGVLCFPPGRPALQTAAPLDGPLVA